MFNKQKRYFKKKLVGVQNTIWDLEFKRFKNREIREELRKQYDNFTSRMGALDETIKVFERVKEEE